MDRKPSVSGKRSRIQFKDLLRFLLLSGYVLSGSSRGSGLPVTAGQAVEAAMRGATILMFSVPSPDAVYQINQFDIFKKELTIRGSFVNPDTHQRAVNLLNSGLINTDVIITHHYGVEDTVKAIKKQTEQDSLKVIITP